MASRESDSLSDVASILTDGHHEGDVTVEQFLTSSEPDYIGSVLKPDISPRPGWALDPRNCKNRISYSQERVYVDERYFEAFSDGRKISNPELIPPHDRRELREKYERIYQVGGASAVASLSAGAVSQGIPGIVMMGTTGLGGIAALTWGLAEYQKLDSEGREPIQKEIEDELSSLEQNLIQFIGDWEIQAVPSETTEEFTSWTKQEAKYQAGFDIYSSP